MTRTKTRQPTLIPALIVAACLAGTSTAHAEGPLDTVFAHFDTDHRELGTFQVVNQLSLRLGISALFIEVPQKKTGRPKAHEPAYAIDANDVTPREILDTIVQEDPAYTWIPVSDRLVNVVPVAMLEDPDSALNYPVSNVVLDDVPIREAADAIAVLLPANLRFFGMVTPNPQTASGFDLIDRRISLSLPSGTYLDLLNAFLAAAGDDTAWLFNSVGSPGVVRMHHENVPTKSRVAADAYLKSDGPTLQEALSKYRTAYDDAPYAALRTYLLGVIGELHLGGDGPYNGIFPNAAPDYDAALDIFTALAIPRTQDDVIAQAFRSARGYALDILLKQGKVSEAKRLVEEFLALENSAQLVPHKDLYASIIHIEIKGLDRETALRKLTAMRVQEPQNETFHQALDTRITRLERGINP